MTKQDAINELTRAADLCPTTPLAEACRMAVDALSGVAPTVDAVPVVRCKDCKHYGFTDNRIPEEQVWWCYFWDDVRSPDAYCSDGERKKDGDT